MFPLPSIAIPVGLMNSPLPLPGAPHCNTNEHGGSVVEVDADVDVVVLVVEVVVLVMEVLVEVVVVDEVTAGVEVVSSWSFLRSRAALGSWRPCTPPRRTSSRPCMPFCRPCPCRSQTCTPWPQPRSASCSRSGTWRGRVTR